MLHPVTPTVTFEKSAAFLMFLASISNVDRPGDVAYPCDKKVLDGASSSKTPSGAGLVRLIILQVFIWRKITTDEFAERYRLMGPRYYGS
jgi:hypothetical protein